MANYSFEYRVTAEDKQKDNPLAFIAEKLDKSYIELWKLNDYPKRWELISGEIKTLDITDNDGDEDFN